MKIRNKKEKIKNNSFDTSKVTSMANMFGSTNLTNLDVSNFDTSKVTDMSRCLIVVHY